MRRHEIKARIQELEQRLSDNPIIYSNELSDDDSLLFEKENWVQDILMEIYLLKNELHELEQQIPKRIFYVDMTGVVFSDVPVEELTEVD